MSQYERMVSYLYRYQGEEKEANVGYVRIEKRGEKCRFSIQMRAIALQTAPTVYLYKQFAERIETIKAGSMSVRNGCFWFKGVSSVEKLFQTGVAFEQIDGIFIDAGESVYFATSWKNDTFYKGKWDKDATDVEKWNDSTDIVEMEDEDEKKSSESEEEKSSAPPAIEADEGENGDEKQESPMEENEVNKALPLRQQASPADESHKEHKAVQESEQTVPKTEETKDIQMQSVCGVCPFKRKMYDYGKRILMTFPSMQPFEPNVVRACVRMELQDIGCLPISAWSLSGNRFLLHGYYCYRHLIFMQMQNGVYMLGVPGIYSEKDRRNGQRYGFCDFQSIGDFGKQQGVFGYWLLEMPRISEQS